MGEILVLTRNWNWGADKIARLKSLLRELVVVDIHDQKVLDKYAEIKSYSKKNGFPLGDNDAWIASAASVTESVLLTGDKDFNPLDVKFISMAYVDPADLK